MALDVKRGPVTKNAYRITKVRGKTALRIRVPGGHIESKHLLLVNELAQKYGNGSVHITSRQGFEVPGIDFNKIPEVNKMIRPLIEEIEVACGVEIENRDAGYPAAGTRNVSACIGNQVCPFANVDTTDLAVKMEKNIYPNNYHVKIAITGCPNDCIKAHTQDFGIIGICEPQLEYDYCIGCQACIKNCKAKVTGALTLKNGKVVRDERRCIGCGECVLKCPTGAWTRNPEKFYRVVIMGRTGKRNPRMATSFLEWVTEDTVLKVVKNTYGFVEEHIDKSLVKEHVGYIVDRAGYHAFKKAALKGVELGPKAKVAKHINFIGYQYERDENLK